MGSMSSQSNEMKKNNNILFTTNIYARILRHKPGEMPQTSPGKTHWRYKNIAQQNWYLCLLCTLRLCFSFLEIGMSSDTETAHIKNALLLLYSSLLMYNNTAHSRTDVFINLTGSSWTSLTDSLNCFSPVKIFMRLLS